MNVRRIGRYRMNSALYYVQLLHDARFLRMDTLRNTTLPRVMNALRVLFEWKARRSHIRSFPLVVRLDPSALCNLRCPGCLTPLKSHENRRDKLMTMGTFVRLLDAVKEHAWRMTFYMEGEPTTNPRLFDMIALATRSRLFTSISTNFTLMREEWLRPLFDSALDYISICLDGFTQSAYQTYRINGNVERVKAGIRMLMEYKRSHHCERPFVNVYTITFGHVVPELGLIEEFCKEQRVDQLTIRPDESNFDGASPQVAESPSLPLSRCHWPWTSLQVDADGSVYPCPVSFQHLDHRPYGNINSSTFEELWNGDRYQATREYVSGRLGRDDPRAKDLPCLKCRWYGSNPNAEGPPGLLAVAKNKEQRRQEASNAR